MDQFITYADHLFIDLSDHWQGAGEVVWTSVSMLEKLSGRVLACWRICLGECSHDGEVVWTSFARLEKLPAQVLVDLRSCLDKF